MSKLSLPVWPNLLTVDLNPIRANICASLEESEYTSVKQRIDEISPTKPQSSHTPPIKLAQFIGASHNTYRTDIK